jgi:hypothetical protein
MQSEIVIDEKPLKKQLLQASERGAKRTRIAGGKTVKETNKRSGGFATPA